MAFFGPTTFSLAAGVNRGGTKKKKHGSTQKPSNISKKLSPTASDKDTGLSPRTFTYGTEEVY